MPDVEALFEDYVARYHAGDAPDALEYLERAGDQANDLAAMIAVVLESAPTPPSTEPARIRALAVPVIAALSERDFGAVLVALRRQTGETRASFSRQLADALGVAPKAAKVKRYYADLENGLLPPSRLQRSVLDALADLLGTSRSLLEAARATWRPRPAGADAAFHRAEATLERPLRLPETKAEPDEVDALFFGGA